jgi:hypothetical protein
MDVPFFMLAWFVFINGINTIQYFLSQCQTLR